MKAFLILLSLIFSLPGMARALELAVPFSNDMILQRRSLVPVWGFDHAGSRVVVEFAGQRKETVATQSPRNRGNVAGTLAVLQWENRSGHPLCDPGCNLVSGNE